jgi:hypothetical protein
MFMKITTTLWQDRFSFPDAAPTAVELVSIDSFQPQSDTWVKLRDRPNDYSDDEALLLCETVAGAWLGWVPGFGQIDLQPGEFYRIV